MVIISLYKVASDAACFSLQEIAKRSVAKSLFLCQEAGVWMATAEAQRAMAALREELATSRDEAAAAREDARLTTLAEQNVFMQYKAEVEARRWAKKERAVAEGEAQQAR